MENLFFDLVVIGGGPGGYTAAIHAAQLGMRVALVEKAALGGTCLNRGCIPVAAMLHAGEIFRKMRFGEGVGICARDVRVDYGRLLSYREATVRTIVQGVDQMLELNGVRRFYGRGTFMPGRRVCIISTEGRTVLTAGHVLLATGSVARTLGVPGGDLPGVTDSDGALDWETMPESLTVIGGGVIGVEFAQMFSDLGSRVTLLGTRDRLLPSLDKEISQNLRMVLKKRGIDVHTGATVKRIVRESGMLRCVYTEKDTEKTAVSQRILCAVGREPNTDRLFEGTTVGMERGRIVVDDHFQTELEGVYAVGDVIGGAQTAHMAVAQGTAAVAYMAGRSPCADVNTVPVCVYTDPEIAAVGLTERNAREIGRPVRTGKGLTGRNGRSVVSGEEHGFVKIVAAADDGVILGAQFMCARAGDMIGELVTAVSNRLTAEQLLRAVRPHPTYNEMLSEALESVVCG